MQLINLRSMVRSEISLQPPPPHLFSSMLRFKGILN